MSSSTTTAPSRRPLIQALRDAVDPRDRRGVRHDPPTILSLAVTGILAGCGSLMAIWEHITDLEADDPRSSGPEAGRAPPSQVHHPQGPAGFGSRGPRCPPDLLVAYAHRRHRGKNSDRGGRQDHARGPHRGQPGPAPASRPGPGPRSRRGTKTGGRQVQRDPRPARTARSVGPGRGPDHRRRHGAPAGAPPSGSAVTAPTTR